MKRFLPACLALAAGIVLLVSGSCKKDDNTTSSANTIKDIDGNVYHTVTIGTQVWLAENLEVTHYRNGESINNVNDSTQWGYETTGAYCRYNAFRNPSTINDKLYNWYAVTDSRNIAPEGYHIPTEADWNTLVSFLGGESAAGGKLKEIGTSHWATPNTNATNETGFTALPDGLLNYYGAFSAMGTYSYFWSKDEFDAQEAYYRSLSFSNGIVTTGHFFKNYGLSVRCVKD